MLQALIRCDADVNAVNNYGETTLMFAAKRGNSAFCEILLESGGKQIHFYLFRKIVSTKLYDGTL